MKWPWGTNRPKTPIPTEVKDPTAETPPADIQQKLEEIARYEESVRISQARLRSLRGERA